jgi:ribonuclease VapC
MVLEGRYGPDAGADLELFLFDARAEMMPFDSRQAQAAMRAWRKYGKGRHPAQLNPGDCWVYALAKVSGEPVLCKGADFSRTDIPLVA